MCIRTFDWLTNHKVLEKYKIICDWSLNRICFSPEEFLIKITLKGFKERKLLRASGFRRTPHAILTGVARVGGIERFVVLALSQEAISSGSIRYAEMSS